MSFFKKMFTKEEKVYETGLTETKNFRRQIGKSFHQIKSFDDAW